MYHPYFRGKQYELITIRETADVLAGASFVPVIEPVRESLGGLQRTLDAVCKAGGGAVVIVNPHYGDLSSGAENISDLINSVYCDDQLISAGILLKENTAIDAVLDYCAKHQGVPLTLVHGGFSEAKMLSEELPKISNISKHIFLEDHCGKLYRRNFQDKVRVLVRDGFERRRNRDHPAVELFSDLHITYVEEGVNGYGDFLIVGDDYSETGGPAYAVAIHLTFIDSEKDDAMYVYHFISDRQDTPTDPAGKFAEALGKLMAEVNKPDTKLLRTSAIAEFEELYSRQHFPGLGYVKKLSMKHHIETLAEFAAQ